MTNQGFSAKGKVGSYTDRNTPSGRKRTVEVFVKITVEPKEFSEDTQTVDHEQVTEGYHVSISGVSKATNRKNGEVFGQIYNELDKITDYAEGWSRELHQSLKLLWRDWHLNDMCAGCDHQIVVGESISERLHNTLPCPETGYRYGSEWLYRPVPENVYRALYILSTKLTGDYPG